MSNKDADYYLLATSIASCFGFLELDLTQLLYECPLSELPLDFRLSVIVPSYNERENMPELIGRVASALGSISFEFMVVDDNSPDGTADVLMELNKKYPNLNVLKRPGKLGLSSAVIAGLGQSSIHAQVFAVMDADMQHPPELLPKMYSKILDGYDLVVASRYVTGGRVSQWGASRIVISKVATLLAHLLLPETRRVRDIMSGFFVVKRQVLDSVNFDPVGFKILLEILVKGNYLAVLEVPYTFGSRQNGASNLNSKEIWNYIVHIYKLMKSKKNPKMSILPSERYRTERYG